MIEKEKIMATNNELFASIALVKGLLDTDNVETLKKVIDEIYVKLGGSNIEKEDETKK